MIYAYYRVSSDRQDYENQKYGVVEYARRNNLTIDKEYIDDGVSGCVLAKERNLWKIVRRAGKGDLLIVPELSRIGRSTSDVLNTVQILCQKGVNVYLVKQNMMLDQSPIGKLLTAIMAAFAEMERDLLSQRTKEALARKKAEGKHLGRPHGYSFRKLNKEDVIGLANSGYTKTEIAKMLDCSWITVHRFMCENNIKIYKKES